MLENVERDSHEPGILFLTTRRPRHDNGNAIRIANVLEGLLEVGSVHMCLIDSTNDGPRPDPDARLTTTVIQAHDRSRLRRVLGILGRNPSSIPYRRNGALGELLVQSLGRTHWDLVWCVRARVHVLTRSLISGPRIVDFDDLYDRLLLTQIRDRRRELGPIGTAPRNLFEWVDARRWSRLQKTVASEVDKVVICSTLDRDRLGASNAAVVPNGYPNPLHSHGEGAARAMTGESPRLSLLFVGPLTYEPNRLAIHWMVENVLPRLRERMPRVALTVVGDDRGVSVRSMDGDGVLFTGHVDDVEPYYEYATVAVAPLHSGGGTRLKVIEALARGVPLVSTSFAVEGLDVAPGRDVLIADDPETFANTCLTLATEPNLRQRLVEAGLARYRGRLTAAATSAAARRLATDVMNAHRGN